MQWPLLYFTAGAEAQVLSFGFSIDFTEFSFSIVAAHEDSHEEAHIRFFI